MAATDIFNQLRLRLSPYQSLLSALPHYAERGRIGVGMNQNRMGTCYPFELPLLGVTGLVANLDLQYPAKKFKPPFFFAGINRKHGLAESSSLRWRTMTASDWLSLQNYQLSQANDVAYSPNSYPVITIADADNNIITTSALTTKQQILISDTNTAIDCVSYFWADRDGLIQLHYAEYRLANDLTAPLIFPKVIIDRVPIVSRCCHGALNPIRLTDSREHPPQTTELEFVAGKSVHLNLTDHQITIDADSPERYDGDRQRIPVKTINGQNPDSVGNFKFRSDKCFHVDRPINEGEVIPSTLELRNDCIACCSCDQYVQFYEVLRQLRDVLDEKIASLTKMRERYDALRTIYDSRVNDMLLNNVQVIATTTENKALINFAINNAVNKQVTNLVCLIEFYGIGWGSQAFGTIDSFYNGSVTVAMKGSWPYYYFEISKIPAFKVEYFRLSMSFPTATKESRIDCCISVYKTDSLVTPSIIQSPVPTRRWGELTSGLPYLFGAPVCVSVNLAADAVTPNVAIAPPATATAVS
jgi:hypothetical protein